MGIIPQILAHEGEDFVAQIIPALDQTIRSNSIKFTILALIAFLILTLMSLVLKNKAEQLKYALFLGFVIVALINTVYLAGSTIYLNSQSTTGGPIHWHADFEIWNCGKKVEIVDPQGLSNKVGTEVIHEHNDNRIHIEGVILDTSHASLSHFFEQLGGEFHNNHMSIPVEEGVVILEDGNLCPDGKTGNLQVFVYRTLNGTFSQTKFIDPEDYIISPQSQVPPGDCIIIEFGEFKEKTDKLCDFYEVAVIKGELRER